MITVITQTALIIVMKTKLNFYKQFLENIHRSFAYYNFLRPYFEYLEAEKLDFFALTKDDFTKYFTVKKYQSNSINNLIKASRDFCRYQNITDHVCFQVKLLKPEKRIRQYIHEEDIKKAIKYIATYNDNLNVQKIETVLYFLLYTGCRKSEVLNLKRDKFNFEKNNVQIYEQKLKREKIIPFPSKFAPKLQDYFRSDREQINAFNMTEAQIDDLFGRIMSKYLGKHLSPHMLRHGSAKYLLNKGIELTCLQKILGHSDIKTTMIYAEADEREIEKNYRKSLG
jgi:site-specific recombinase XerD